MSTSILLSDHLTLFNCTLSSFTPHTKNNHKFTPNFRFQHRSNSKTPRNIRVLRLLVPNAKKKKGLSSKKKSWWRKFFLEEDGNWLGLREEDLEENEVIDEQNEGSNEEEEKGLSEEEKFKEWKKRAEAIIELREAQEGIRNEKSRNWEDWLVFEEGGINRVKGEWSDYDDNRVEDLRESDVVGDPNDMLSERGLVEYVRDFVLGREEDELLYEDKVFRYASRNSAKFLVILVIVPWALDLLVHDYVLMPFLERYVKTVPLAAEMLDVRRNQKIEMVKELHTEKARLRFEMEIGKSPPLSDEEMWWEVRHKALELRDEWRLENRRAFANIWSDVVFGLSLFLLLYFNQRKVALLKFTGYKILNNISDTGKAFLIILITDIFLGYHSESGWQTVCEVIVEHYGLEVDQAAITLFICLVPVIMDACVKLWLFKFLPRLSPKVSNIFTEMKRH